MGRRPASLGVFFFRATLWFLVLTATWVQVSDWVSYPVSGITRIVLGNGARDWIRTTHIAPGGLVLDTRIPVAVQGQLPNRTAELIVEVSPARYGYGLPLFLAMLLAAGTPNFLLKAMAGYCVLLLPQAISVIFDILKQILVVGGTPAILGISSWQMEGIALGYQFGALLLPTLAPILMWLWADRAFFVAMVMDG